MTLQSIACPDRYRIPPTLTFVFRAVYVSFTTPDAHLFGCLFSWQIFPILSAPRRSARTPQPTNFYRPAMSVSQKDAKGAQIVRMCCYSLVLTFSPLRRWFSSDYKVRQPALHQCPRHRPSVGGAKNSPKRAKASLHPLRDGRRRCVTIFSDAMMLCT